MKRIYTTLFTLSFFAFTLSAQTITVPPNEDGTAMFPFTYLNVFVEADTAANGDQNNSTYLLEAGGLYFFTAKAEWTFDVAFRATGDVETLGKPIISRANATGGTSLGRIYQGFGNLTFDGIYIILGEEGPDAAAYETSPIRPEGDDRRYIFNNCILEKSRQGHIRIEGENSKTYVTNCIIRNYGDYERLQGNGRVVDVRDNFADSVVIRNNVIHNILDRVFIGFRMQGLNYFEFSQNTLFNHVGRHGMIQLKNTKETVIKDNLIMNPSIIGTSPSLANEQINFVNQTTYLISLDTVVAGASMDISNNNIFWTDDVLNHYATSDSVTQPPVLSPEVVGLLAEPDSAFFTEVLELNNVPIRQPLIDYAREAVLYPDSVGITDIMVEDSLREGTPYDKGYLFNFSAFDPCYSLNTRSASAASDGGGVGVQFLCNYTVSTSELAYNHNLELKSSPNPASDLTNLTYFLSRPGEVDLTVYDMQGHTVRHLQRAELPAGDHTVTWNNLNEIPTGMYFVNLQTEEGRMFIKVVVK